MPNTLRPYRITKGLFATDWDAIDAMLGAFHDARRISARRLPV